VARVEVLSAEQPSRWHEQLLKAGCTDVYFSPEYAGIFTAVDGGKPQLFVYEEDGRSLIYPFRLRQMPRTEQFSEFSEWFDITSDYGYGGPFIRACREEEALEFATKAVRSFGEYCKESRIVSEFCRFHPLINNALYMKNEYRPSLCNRTVWVDLTLQEEDYWRQLRRNHRQDILRTEKAGVEIETSHCLEAADSFYRLYTDNMKHLGADPYYFFTPEFFHNTVRLLGGRVSIFLGRYGGDFIGGVLYICGGEFSHAHFSATDRHFSYLRPTKLLHHHAVLWSKRRGLKRLHLGGGVDGSDTDALMHFKAGFSRLRADFYVARRIHHREVYHKLCARVGVDPEAEGFFPAYRAINRRGQEERE